MVRNFNVLVAILFLCSSAFAQLCEKNDSLIEFGNGVCEQLPALVNYSIDDFIDSVMIYPVSALSDSMQGIVFIRCEVEITGSTNNHCVLKGLSNDMNNEAMRIARLIKFDIPAKTRGKPVKINYVIPIKFRFEKHEKQ